MNQYGLIKQQRGLSLLSMLLLAAVLLVVVVVGMKVMQAQVQDHAIQKTLETLVNNRELITAPPEEIRQAFYRQAAVDRITAVHENEMFIGRQPGRLVLSFEYQVRIPLLANASLLLEFNPSSMTK
jgi:hypothetical protein